MSHYRDFWRLVRRYFWASEYTFATGDTEFTVGPANQPW
jgi:hypothetical protein